MTTKKIVAALFFVDFLALNVYAFATTGFHGISDFVTGLGPWGWVAVADAVIALGMAAVWMWQDARRTGRSVAGFLLLTALTGCLGPLLYVVTGKGARSVDVGRAIHAKATL